MDWSHSNGDALVEFLCLAGGSYDVGLIYATSTGDVYGQRLEQRRIGSDKGGVSGDTPPAVALVQRSSLVSDRIQSM